MNYLRQLQLELKDQDTKVRKPLVYLAFKNFENEKGLQLLLLVKNLKRDFSLRAMDIHEVSTPQDYASAILITDILEITTAKAFRFFKSKIFVTQSRGVVWSYTTTCKLQLFNKIVVLDGDKELIATNNPALKDKLVFINSFIPTEQVRIYNDIGIDDSQFILGEFNEILTRKDKTIFYHSSNFESYQMVDWMLQLFLEANIPNSVLYLKPTNLLNTPLIHYIERAILIHYNKCLSSYNDTSFPQIIVDWRDIPGEWLEIITSKCDAIINFCGIENGERDKVLGLTYNLPVILSLEGKKIHPMLTKDEEYCLNKNFWLHGDKSRFLSDLKSVTKQENEKKNMIFIYTYNQTEVSKWTEDLIFNEL